MNEAFDRDPFSNSFNVLKYMGLWRIDTDITSKRILYHVYRMFSFAFGAHIAAAGLFELYFVRNDFKKVAFNMCTTTLTSAITIKNLHLILLSDRLNKLRFSLFKDKWELKDPEDVRIANFHLDILHSQRKLFYAAAYILLPAWLASSLTTLKWGPREFPFSVWMPYNLDDNFEFAVGFIYQILGSIFIVAETIQADMGMFGLILQITAQYEILARKIMKIDEMYSGKYVTTKSEINKALINRKTKLILKDCIQRHMVLKSYTHELEFCYHKPMMVQISCGFLLTIVNGLELIVSSMDFSLKLSYQIGYLLIVIGDVLIICILSDKLKSRCEDVNFSIYDISWYDMSSDVRKALLLVMIGAQKSAVLTASKMFKLDLTTFLGLLRNCYSWLALCSQLLTKK